MANSCKVSSDRHTWPWHMYIPLRTHIHTKKEGNKNKKISNQTKSTESGSWLTELNPSGSFLAGGPVTKSGATLGSPPWPGRHSVEFKKQLGFGGCRLLSTALSLGPLDSDATSGV